MRTSKTRWIDTWATALHPDDVHRQFWGNICFPLDRAFRDCTIRQQVRIGGGSTHFRFRISNEFAESSLSITRMTIALPSAHNGSSHVGSPMILSHSIKAVTFEGQTSVEIPGGVTWLSDPVDFPLKTGADFTISLYLSDGQQRSIVAGHEMAKATSWLAHGDHSSSEYLPSTSNPLRFSRWYYITGIERVVDDDEDAANLVCLGDSITDQGNTEWDTNQYLGWPNLLARRLQDSQKLSHISVLNCGISGDQLWRGGLKRFDRDVISRTGVKYLFILMGTNDLGNTPDLPEDQKQLYERLISSYQQITDKCHTRGISVFASTITPFLTDESQDNKRDSLREDTRLRVNEWLRTRSQFDYVVDWAKTLGTPSNPHVMDKKYRYNDFVHPNKDACRSMAETIDLDAFLVGGR